MQSLENELFGGCIIKTVKDETMEKTLVCLLTVGHSPREDIAADLQPLLPGTIELEQRGALDGIEPARVRAEFTPAEGEASYKTRLADKTMADVSSEKVLPLMQRRIDEAEAAGASAVVIICTSKFPVFRARIPVISPFSLLHTLVPVLAGKMKVAAAFPFAPYGDGMARDWKDVGIDVAWEYVTPGPELSGSHVAEIFKDKRAELLVLDCIGYSFPVKEETARLLGIPVIQPKKLIADILSTLFT